MYTLQYGVTALPSAAMVVPDDDIKAEVRDILKVCMNHGNDDISFVTIACFAGHSFKVYLRCGSCPGCYYQERLRVMARFIARAEYYGVSQFFMWTFGTDLELNDVNEKKLKDWWHKLCTRLSTYAKRSNGAWSYVPLFRVIEIGSEGKKLHYHVVYGGYMPHDIALNAWRDITGLQANVNFTKNKEGRTMYSAASYVSKYVTKNRILLKSTRSYYWMGKFRKNPQRESIDRTCKEPGCSELRYVQDYAKF